MQQGNSGLNVGSGPDAPSPVTSVFGRIGAVVAAAGDYLASQITNDSGVPGATVKDALNNITAPVTSVFGRIGAVVAAVGDYVASQINNDSSKAGTTVKDVLDNIVQSTAERAADLSIPTASGFVLAVTLPLPTFIVSGNTVEIISNFCGVNSAGATINWELRQGATVLDRGYQTMTAAWALNVTSIRRIALVSNSDLDLYISTNSGTFSIRAATVPQEHARILITKY